MNNYRPISRFNQGILLFILFFCFHIEAQNENNTKLVENRGISHKDTLITVGKPFVIYKLPFAFDHTIIHNKKDEKWHLYGIMKPTNKFIHLTADSLTQRNWIKKEPFSYKGMTIWAPHIIYHKNLYYMFYTSIGVPRQIRYATSKDLNYWEHPKKEPLFAHSNEHSENLKNKDPMVFRYKDSWIMYYSMMKDAKHWVVAYSTSADLINWSEPNICFDEHTESPGVESPFVVQRGEFFYLFLSARPWPLGSEEVFKSKSPYFWQPENSVKKINPWHAAEVIQDIDGQWYLSRSSGEEEDFKLAPMQWNDGLEEKQAIIPQP